MRVFGKKIHTPRRYVFGQHRRNPLVRIIAHTAKGIAALHENENRNMETNGESWLLKQVVKYFDGQLVAFDVGANTGEWTIKLKKAAPNAIIHAFELFPAHYETFKKNTKHLSSIYPVAFGLSDREKDVEIFLNGGESMVSLFETVRSHMPEKSMGKVIIGDTYVENCTIEKINFLKIDVEGAERQVIDGFAKTIKAGKVDVIVFEYGEFNIPSRSFLKDFYEILEGYTIGRVFPKWVEFTDYDYKLENFRSAYYVAIKNDLTDLIESME